MRSAPAPNPKLIAARLGSARRRIQALLEQISVLQGSDFPHVDGELALLEIRKHFEDLLREFEGAEKYRLQVIQDLCLKASWEVELHLPVLGFILRSTNVRNAFEIYDPLKSIVEKTIDAKAHLIVSSEWDFVPFTYPMSLDVLPRYVLVGGPAHESDSAFLTPIAGHEIGHSAWKVHDVLSLVDASFTERIENLVAADPDLKTELEDYYGSDFAGFLRDFGIKRVEELFCDAFGVCLFGESYLYAFEHLMYPGGSVRGSDYPRIEDRLAFLNFVAERRSVTRSGVLRENWRASSDNPNTDADIDDVLDKAATAIYEQIADAASSMVDASGVATPSETKIGEALSCFASGVPVRNETALCDILCAGWRRVRHANETGSPDQSKLVNELMLKSVEISEFERRSRPC